MTVLKLLSKKRISRELFKVCRLEGFETLAQIEAHFEAHGDFDSLQWCGPAEKKELEQLVGAQVKRLVAQWELPEQLLETPSVLHSTHFLLQKQVLPEKQLQVLLSSFRIYTDSKPQTPAHLGSAMELTDRSVRRLRKLALKNLSQKLRELQCMQEEVQQRYGLDLNAPLLVIDEDLAQQINEIEATDFSPQFLALLFGEYLEAHFSRIGNEEEVLAGNLMSIWHTWKNLYLLRKDLASALDVEALMKESFRLLRHSEVEQLNFRNFVALFVRKPSEGKSASEAGERLAPNASENRKDQQASANGKGTSSENGNPPVSAKGRNAAASTNGKGSYATADSRAPHASSAGRKASALENERGSSSENGKGTSTSAEGRNAASANGMGNITFSKAKWKGDGSLVRRDPHRSVSWESGLPAPLRLSRPPRPERKAEQQDAGKTAGHQAGDAEKGQPPPSSEAHSTSAAGKTTPSFRGSPEKLLELLLPAVAEILKREFGFEVDNGGQLIFPQRKPLLITQYAREALEALGEASRLEVIRHKVEELHPGVVIDTNRFDLVLLDKWGFTYYQHVYGLKEWFGGVRLKALPTEKLKAIAKSKPKKTGAYWKKHWLQQFQALEAFAQEHTRLPEKDGPVEEKVLWNWLHRQMEFHRKGKLDAKQQQLYEGFREDFPVRSGVFFEYYWLDRYEELQAFARKHRRRPRMNSSGEEQSLYIWFSNQRHLLLKGELDTEQKARLNEFTRLYPLKQLSGWEFRFRALKQFTEMHSRLPALESEGEEKRLHYFWIYLLDRKNKGKFTEEQEARITGLKQKYPYNAEHHKQRWDERFEELQDFAEEHGIPSGHDCEGQAKTLRGWLIAQRIRMKKGELDSRQQRLLREFDREHEFRGNRQPLEVWDEKFEALEDFTEKEGRLPKLEAPEDEQVLYRWFVTQRVVLRKGGLEERQEVLLRNFMGRHPLKDAAYLLKRWHDRFDWLEAFVQDRGRLPFTRPEEETPYYQWLLKQQQKAEADKLNQGQLARLQHLLDSYKKKNQLDLYWDARYAELGAFVMANGRLPKKSTDASLWEWYRKQLRRLKAGTLNSSQARSIKRLRRW